MLLIVSIFLLGCGAQVQEQTQQETPAMEEKISEETMQQPQQKTTEDVILPQKIEPRIKEFKIKAFRFEFDPSTIEVNRGDTVRLILTSTDVSHGISIPQFNVNMKIKNAGEEVTAEFVADKSGTFPFFCNVFCGSGHSSMKGTLIVN